MAMQHVVERALLQACTEAAKTLGDDIKGMSCFFSNWITPVSVMDEEAELALTA